MDCPLCLSRETQVLHKNIYREYLKCHVCEGIFVPLKYHLSLWEEKERYLQHNNDPQDQRYTDYLGKMVEVILPSLKKNAKGMDFGSGISTGLADLFKEKKIKCDSYDPHFYPLENLPQNQYDFITSSEVVEHFNNPYRGWREMFEMIKRPGFCAVRTQFYNHVPDFSKWYYIKDPTHVFFYSEVTFKWICEKFHAKLVGTKYKDCWIFELEK